MRRILLSFSLLLLYSLSISQPITDQQVDAAFYEENLQYEQERFQRDYEAIFELAWNLAQTIRVERPPSNLKQQEEFERGRIQLEVLKKHLLTIPTLERVKTDPTPHSLLQAYLLCRYDPNCKQIAEKAYESLLDLNMPTIRYYEAWNEITKCVNEDPNRKPFQDDPVAYQRCRQKVGPIYEEAIALGNSLARKEWNSGEWIARELIDKGNYGPYVEKKASIEGPSHFRLREYYNFSNFAGAMYMWKHQRKTHLFENYKVEKSLGNISRGKSKKYRPYISTANFYLGELYSLTSEMPVYDIEKAFTYYKLSASQGNPAALSKLGDVYRKGMYGHVKDEKKALEYYILAAEKEDGDAMANLGYMYEHGIGCEQDFTKAKDYYIESLKQFSDLGMRLMKTSRFANYLKLVPPKTTKIAEAEFFDLVKASPQKVKVILHWQKIFKNSALGKAITPTIVSEKSWSDISFTQMERLYRLLQLQNELQPNFELFITYHRSDDLIPVGHFGEIYDVYLDLPKLKKETLLSRHQKGTIVILSDEGQKVYDLDVDNKELFSTLNQLMKTTE